jgi:diguanylate cyclase (GGDEF)-like protein/PAS domain S-box-containing protein
MKLRPQSLYLLVTLIVGVSFLLLTVIFAVGQYYSLKRQAFDDSMVNLRTMMMISQSRVEKELATGDRVGMERDVMALKLLDDLLLSAVVNELGVVVSSSNFLILDQPAASQLPQFDSERFDQARRDYRPVIVTDTARENIYAYYPLVISNSGNSVRPDRVGALFVHWSMNRQYQSIRQNLQQEMVQMCGLIVLVLGVLLLVLHRIVLQPVRRLKLKAANAADGREVNSFHIEGVAEIRDLSVAINRMNLKLCANIQEIKRSEERWLFALEGAGDGVLDHDFRNGSTYFSAQLRRLLDIAPEAPVSFALWQQKIHPEDWPYVERRLQRHMQRLSDLCNVEYRVGDSSGQHRYILMRGKVVEWLADGNPARLIATQSDVTARRKMENALRSSEEKYRKLFDLAQEGIWVIDAQGNTTIVNAAMASMLGYKKEEMLSKHLFDFMDASARAVAEENMKRRAHGIEEQHDFELLSKTGRKVYTTMQTAPIFDDNGVYAGAIAGVMDITERRRAEERIRQQVLFDDLTRLPNRRMLNEKLAQEHARALRHDHVGALLFIDLDHFKNVNDSLGHPIGDALLVAIAERLRKVVREEDTLARLGGDEFVVLLPELSHVPTEAASQARQVALKMQAALTETFDVSGHKLTIGCSIGIALYPQEQDTIHDILKQADSAMYRAKEEGRNAVCIFSKEMHEQIERNLRLQMLLPGALEDEQFELYYQPQFNHRRELIGAEVLLRWREPTLGFVRPDQFIRAAEESGFIIPLGDWVLRRACWQLKQWQALGLPATFERLAINISARQFALDDFAHQVQAITRQAGVETHSIELEITESLLLNRLEQVVEKFRELHTMGFYIALDDFGTGYSSLSYLRSLPLHKLKIDQAFVRDIQNDRNDRTIVETIIAMAHHMELEVIAEGVEEEAQFRFLQEKGCLQYQGYYFAKPMPADIFFTTWVQPPAPAQT